MRIVFILSFISFFSSLAQENLLSNLLEEHPEKFGHLFSNPSKYKIQIIYTQIFRDKKNRPTFQSHTFRLSTEEYFYPASTVKFLACILALEKLNNLQIPNLNKNTPMRTQTQRIRDSTTIATHIKKILLVSDNESFNRLYEFIGQKDFNTTLHKKGYKDIRIAHRLETDLTFEENQFTPSLDFFKNGDSVYHQKEQISDEYFESQTPILLGKGYYKNRKIINEPMDFSRKNYFSLENQQDILKAILFPEAVSASKCFNLMEDDYRFLCQYLSEFPSESQYPIYNSSEYYPTYGKFLLWGSDKTQSPVPNIRIFNKAGDAYGFLTDNAYIVDFEKKIEFLLSATILCNEDEIFNDNRYEYETIGYPFFRDLGQLIYEYELGLIKKYEPNLNKFKLNYE